MDRLGRITFEFNVPLTASQYAPEVLYLNRSPSYQGSTTPVDLATISQLQPLVAVLPATAAIEVDLLQPGADPGVEASWRTAAASYNATGLGALLELARWYGVRLRAKSGGTAGPATVDLSWAWSA